MQSSEQNTSEQLCPRCQKANLCSAESSVAKSSTSCWCMTLPYLKINSSVKECLCLNCFKKEFNSQVEDLEVSKDKAQIEQMNHGLSLKDLVHGIDYELEQGKLVMSRWYLMRRGYCCKNNCRNCPYGN